MDNNSCFNLLVYFASAILFFKVIPVIVATLKNLAPSRAITTSSQQSIHSLNKAKVVSLVGMLISSLIVIAGTTLKATDLLIVFGGSLFFLCLAYSGYCDFRLNQIQTKLTAWGGIVVFTVVGISLFLWSVVIFSWDYL